MRILLPKINKVPSITLAWATLPNNEFCPQEMFEKDFVKIYPNV